jgi:hypothetical protein
MHNTCTTDRHSRCWGACCRQLLLTHKPVVLRCQLLWMVLPRAIRTYACLWCGCPSCALGPRFCAGAEQHSCYNTASGIPSTSMRWPVPCCAFLLVDSSQDLLLHIDLLHWTVLPELTPVISQVATLHLPHKPSGKGCLLLLNWHWFRVPKVLMVAPCANSSLLPQDH